MMDECSDGNRIIIACKRRLHLAIYFDVSEVRPGDGRMHCLGKSQAAKRRSKMLRCMAVKNK